MSNYFEEHNCSPLALGEQPNHYLHFARLLLDSGHWQDFNLEFSQLFGDGERPPPATAKEVLTSLKERKVTEADEKCPVCLKRYKEKEVVKVLPCKHDFHTGCIIPWLEKTNSCPLCRYELPTDDPDYEAYRKQKERAKQREADIKVLHNSMFS